MIYIYVLRETFLFKMCKIYLVDYLSKLNRTKLYQYYILSQCTHIYMHFVYKPLNNIRTVPGIKRYSRKRKDNKKISRSTETAL